MPTVLVAFGTLVTRPPDHLAASKGGVVRVITILLIQAMIPLGHQRMIASSKGRMLLPEAVPAASTIGSCTFWAANFVMVFAGNRRLPLMLAS